MGEDLEPQDLPEVRALAERLDALKEEAGLTQGRMVGRFRSNKATVSRSMRGIQHPSWNDFVRKLIEAVEDRRGHPMPAAELRALRLLHERALVARDCHSKGIVLLREELTGLRSRLRTSRADNRRLTALGTATVFAATVGFVFTSVDDLAKGATSVRGDAPRVTTECVALPAGTQPPATCAKTQWRWSLPAPDKGVGATFDLRTGHDTGELGGVLRLKAGCGAAVRWSVTVRVAGAGPTGLAAGTLDRDTPVTLYAPLHRDARTMTFTARRTDGGHCAATVVWDRPRPAITY
ncbi:helix-turn-helix domain-containing protein [Streptomyces sp. SCL15-4]|uniref:helix-turn-helix domain-containing protein n=1 Tax=Streptomyces sp. SCL15-4 TaxID=2967221 RepID=UPI00296654BA|nr:helix-turn-helix domain-containing protein [Streptomyces sp. SCL15-4]